MWDRPWRAPLLAGALLAWGLAWGIGPASAQILFSDVTASAGLASHRAQSGDGHGPGAVFADLDNDGYPDLYLMRAWGNPNELYRNSDAGSGARVFLRMPGDAGAGDTGNATGAIAGDYDNDGDLDLYVLNFDQPNVLLRNLWSETGNLAFQDATASTDPTPGVADNEHGVGIAFHAGVPLDDSLTAAWADVDRDGDLDLYVGNHNSYYNAPEPPEGPFTVPGRCDVFYLNNGDGSFTDATLTYGLTGYETPLGGSSTPNQRFSSSNAVIFADFDNDGWPDLLVTNKVGGPDDRDMLYLNQGNDGAGVWQGMQTVTYGLSPTFGHRSGGAMGVDVADPDHDGDLDIYITDWSELDPPGPGLNDYWVNQLSETGQLSFIHSSAMAAQFSWGAQFQDFDNDGWEDLHVGTQDPAPDYLYRNFPSGFLEQAAAAGVDQTANVRGDLTADYNRDGWPDLFLVVREDAPSLLYENRSSTLSSDRHFLSLKLRGDPSSAAPHASSRDALGARVQVLADLDGDGAVGVDEIQLREVVSGSSNAASTSSLELEFGLGAATEAVVLVRWPSGRGSLHELAADQWVTLDEGTLSGAELLVNGGFETELSGWVSQLAGGGSALWSVDPAGPSEGQQSLRADVLAVDGTDWHVQVHQGQRALLAGQRYRLAFEARASVPSPLHVQTGMDHAPWSNLGLAELVALGPGWQHFEFLFTASASDPDARLGFQLGSFGPRTVWLDGVSLRPALACEDGIDNDGDGLVDHGQDPGCQDAGDPSETAGPACGVGPGLLPPLLLLLRRRRATARA